MFKLKIGLRRIGEEGSRDGFNALFNLPCGIVVGLDQIYVCDKLNHTIRSISWEGYVSTIAGTTGVSVRNFRELSYSKRGSKME
jgi:hypothetical protein